MGAAALEGRHLSQSIFFRGVGADSDSCNHSSERHSSGPICGERHFTPLCEKEWLPVNRHRHQRRVLRGNEEIAEYYSSMKGLRHGLLIAGVSMLFGKLGRSV